MTAAPLVVLRFPSSFAVIEMISCGFSKIYAAIFFSEGGRSGSISLILIKPPVIYTILSTLFVYVVFFYVTPIVILDFLLGWTSTNVAVTVAVPVFFAEARPLGDIDKILSSLVSHWMLIKS